MANQIKGIAIDPIDPLVCSYMFLHVILHDLLRYRQTLPHHVTGMTRGREFFGFAACSRKDFSFLAGRPDRILGWNPHGHPLDSIARV